MQQPRRQQPRRHQGKGEGSGEEAEEAGGAEEDDGSFERMAMTFATSCLKCVEPWPLPCTRAS